MIKIIGEECREKIYEFDFEGNDNGPYGNGVWVRINGVEIFNFVEGDDGIEVIATQHPMGDLDKVLTSNSITPYRDDSSRETAWAKNYKGKK